jgi:hypothetical protein
MLASNKIIFDWSRLIVPVKNSRDGRMVAANEIHEMV